MKGPGEIERMVTLETIPFTAAFSKYVSFGIKIVRFFFFKAMIHSVWEIIAIGVRWGIK